MMPTPAAILTPAPTPTRSITGTISVDSSERSTSNGLTTMSIGFDYRIRWDDEPAYPSFVFDSDDGGPEEAFTPPNPLPTPPIYPPPGVAPRTLSDTMGGEMGHTYATSGRTTHHVTLSANGRVIASMTVSSAVDAPLVVPSRPPTSGSSSAVRPTPILLTAGDRVFVPGFGRPGHDIVEAASGPVWSRFTTLAEERTPLTVDLGYAVRPASSGRPATTRLILRWHDPITRCDYVSGPRAGRFTLIEDGRQVVLTASAFDDSNSVVDGFYERCGDEIPILLLRRFSLRGHVDERPGPRIDGRATVSERVPGVSDDSAKSDVLFLDAATALPIRREIVSPDGAGVLVDYRGWTFDPSMPIPNASPPSPSLPDASAAAP